MTTCLPLIPLAPFFRNRPLQPFDKLTGRSSLRALPRSIISRQSPHARPRVTSEREPARAPPTRTGPSRRRAAGGRTSTRARRAHGAREEYVSTPRGAAGGLRAERAAPATLKDLKTDGPRARPHTLSSASLGAPPSPPSGPPSRPLSDRPPPEVPRGRSRRQADVQCR